MAEQEPPALMDDMVREILLRVPPDHPEFFFRAALVCKPWLTIIREEKFRKRYYDFHRLPPLLGFLQRLRPFNHVPLEPAARFASLTALPGFVLPSFDGRRIRPLDCRHGRILIHMLRSEQTADGYLIWDPVTGDRHILPSEPNDIDWSGYSAVVLCASHGCEHIDCHGGPFRVVFVATDAENSAIIGSVYSSESGTRSARVSMDGTYPPFAQCLAEHDFYVPDLQPMRGTLVGDSVYFAFRYARAIVKFDLGKDCLSILKSPTANAFYFSLMALEGSSCLGFCSIEGSCLYIWSLKLDADQDPTYEAAPWEIHKIIELENTIPSPSNNDRVVVGFAEGVDVIFINCADRLYTVKLTSELVEEVHKPGLYFSILPYMSFCLPG